MTSSIRDVSKRQIRCLNMEVRSLAAITILSDWMGHRIRIFPSILVSKRVEPLILEYSKASQDWVPSRDASSSRSVIRIRSLPFRIFLFWHDAEDGIIISRHPFSAIRISGDEQLTIILPPEVGGLEFVLGTAYVMNQLICLSREIRVSCTERRG